jgi:hypothetical protein
MNPERPANSLRESVIAYCDAIDVPGYDEAAILSRVRLRSQRPAPSRRRLKFALCVAAALALLVVLYDIPAVVAGVQRVFAAFTVTEGRTTPMSIRVVDLQRARADAPFAVIAPPPVANAPIVTVDEVNTQSNPSDASIVFELHGRMPGPEVMIVESDAASHPSRTLFALREAAAAPNLSRPPTPESPDRPGAVPRLVLRGSFGGRAFTPASWVAHGTRVVIMSPPGFLSAAQLKAIRGAMSR